MKPDYWDKATRALSRKDATLKKIIKAYKGETMKSRGDLFHTLARSITGQQISVKAADSVWNKMQAGLKKMEPAAVLRASDDTLRGYGLSGQKVKYLRHIAEHCHNHQGTIDTWHTLEDEALIKELVRLKGVGRWTAEMILIFHYQRPDIFPVDDLGVLKAISRHYNGGKPVTRRQAVDIAETWRPWRSVATWYLWRALDPLAIEY